MTDNFNGFSQDEINNLTSAKFKHKKVGQTKVEAFRSQQTEIRRIPEKWSKQQVTSRPSGTSDAVVNSKLSSSSPAATTTNKASSNAAAINETIKDEISYNLDGSMSKSIEEALFYQPMTLPSAATTNGQHVNNATSAESSSILKLSEMSDNISLTSTTSFSTDESSILEAHKLSAAEACPVAVISVDSPFKGISLKDFESHRRMIEEQNKQKKDLLYKAIEHHSQKTAAEARKIQEIKAELAKLDNDLALDVAILRKQIDLACIHFANVEKQYTKIEAQFLKSKIDLHNAAEKKELLTEHLCTVIAHNEDRKAQKLSELMQKVGLPPSGDLQIVTPAIDK